MIRLFRCIATFVLCFIAFCAQAASRFDAINFQPTVDSGRYVSVYDARTWQQWQGSMGFYVDYAHSPLKFGGAFPGIRQGIIDRMVVANLGGSIGLADWLTVGANVPVVGYNWFYSDTPVAAPTGTADGATSLGDIEMVLKLRLINNETKHFGLALVPFMSFPTGDEVRYTGSGFVTGGGMMVGEFVFSDKTSLALNAGARFRNSVLRHGIAIDDEFLYGAGFNHALSNKIDFIAELSGSSVMKNIFKSKTTSPLEGRGALRFAMADSGYALTVGAGGGIVNGVGTPLFRGFAGLSFTGKKQEQKIKADKHIQGDKIIVWGKIFYDTGKTTIKPISYAALDEVVDVLKMHTEILLLEVQGHTDSRSDDEYNLRLSQGRAAAAKQYLVSKGIDPKRLIAVGYGEEKPIATNKTPDGMSQNRRTEFVILTRLPNPTVN